MLRGNNQDIMLQTPAAIRTILSKDTASPAEGAGATHYTTFYEWDAEHVLAVPHTPFRPQHVCDTHAGAAFLDAMRGRSSNGDLVGTGGRDGLD
jgi:hypothetical protein